MHPRRCRRCGLYDQNCLCQQIAPLQLETEIIIITHYKETHLASNTARLAHLSLDNSSLLLHGVPEQPCRLQLELQRRYYILYPSAQCTILSSEIVKEDCKPISLIVPDGSWRQTKRMVRRLPLVSQIKHLALPPGPPTRYDLRRQSRQEHLCTFEAIARALGIIEGELVQQQLEKYFAMMIRSEMALRGCSSSWDEIRE